MRRIICSLIGILALTAAFAGPADQFISFKEAEKKWGNRKYSKEEFSGGDSQVRGSMAADLVKGKYLIGMPIEDVRIGLGKQTGYFFSDQVPAYAIGDLGPVRRDTWQIVILADKAGKKVSEVKIHKKCCYK
jgi:hypothetical protein